MFSPAFSAPPLTGEAQTVIMTLVYMREKEAWQGKSRDILPMGSFGQKVVHLACETALKTVPQLQPPTGSFLSVKEWYLRAGEWGRGNGLQKKSRVQ